MSNDGVSRAAGARECIIADMDGVAERQWMMNDAACYGIVSAPTWSSAARDHVYVLQRVLRIDGMFRRMLMPTDAETRPWRIKRMRSCRSAGDPGRSQAGAKSARLVQAGGD